MLDNLLTDSLYIRDMDRSKKWRMAHPEKARAVALAYYYRNAEEIKAKKREEYKADPSRQIAKTLAWRARHPIRMLFLDAKNRAKRKGITFTITESDISIPEVCPLLGLKLLRGGGRNSPCAPSLDRIDNSFGYVPGNVWVISYRANAIKRDSSLEEFGRIFSAWKAFLGNV